MTCLIWVRANRAQFDSRALLKISNLSSSDLRLIPCDLLGQETGPQLRLTYGTDPA